MEDWGNGIKHLINAIGREIQILDSGPPPAFAGVARNEDLSAFLKFSALSVISAVKF